MISRLATNLHAWGLLALVWGVLGAFWLGSFYGSLGVAEPLSSPSGTYHEIEINAIARQTGQTRQEVLESLALINARRKEAP